MAERKKRLELTWIGKDERPRLEPRILLEDTALSYRAAKRVTDHDHYDNRLIHGDNLLALKALEQEFAGKIKCIYIDPPYNTRSAFEHYDDGVEHSVWLSLLQARLVILRDLLSADGSLWISIDDNELHYLKILCDEIFGRANYVTTIVASMNPKGRQLNRYFADVHEYVLCFAKDISQCSIVAESVDGVNPDDFPLSDDVGRYRLLPLRNTNKKFNPTTRPNLYYPVYFHPETANISLEPTKGRIAIFPEFGDGKPAVWRWGKEKLARDVAQVHVKQVTRAGNPVYDVFQRDYLEPGRTKKITTFWPSDEIGSTDEAKREVKAFVPDDVFGTPKPERLIRRILETATKPDDWVLDSFAGSGTTGAVAHKMRRRWIMVELGNHCVTHIIPRMRQIIDGSDQGGVSEKCEWLAGGGFRFFNLAPSLLDKDKWGNWIVSKKYHPEMLAEAMCKLEGFYYAPDPDLFWIHGKSTERDFIYVTTQNLSREQLQFISGQVGTERTLLICCSAFRAKNEEFGNLTIKKIPQAVLSRCEWGRDDYSLNIDELPAVQAVEEAKAGADVNGIHKGEKTKTGGRRKKTATMQGLSLFAGLDNGGKFK